ncbi:putative F-box protein At2g19630 [Capsella rubella]|uniref:putative F-box protein At2g19630 n=1 Tax=Capsella rubella TaxID=81985 RepID=UPI000CD54319|nr:putative F-box protein At2g19630 [Capsella rubella]
MKTEQQNVSEEDLVAVTERNTRLKTSINGREPIPVDLTLEICSRLPAKSTSRLRCVSKLWDSIPRLPYFTELFLTRSLSRPRLLFASRKDNHVFFFSSPQPQNLDDNNSSVLTATYHMKTPYHATSFERCSSVRSLIFVGDERILKEKKHKVSVICNPSTGQSVTLPKLKTRKRIGMRSYFGYEPIEKQYKVLSMTWKFDEIGSSEEHQVLTLGTGGKLSWRRIKCCIPHSFYYNYDHVCIDGVLYYPALKTSSRDCIIVLFDLRSEKFRFVEDTDPLTDSYYCSPLINYNEDAEKHEWSEHIYVLPALWKNIVGGEDAVLRIVGVTRTNEIVLSFPYQSTPLVYVFYYNTERNEIRRVEIQGMEAFMGHYIYTFLDHVEDVNVRHI